MLVDGDVVSVNGIGLAVVHNVCLVRNVEDLYKAMSCEEDRSGKLLKPLGVKVKKDTKGKWMTALDTLIATTNLTLERINGQKLILFNLKFLSGCKHAWKVVEEKDED